MKRLAISPSLNVSKKGDNTTVTMEGNDYFVLIEKQSPKWFNVSLRMNPGSAMVSKIGIALSYKEALFLAERALFPYLPLD